jgi:hypothetical protein
MHNSVSPTSEGVTSPELEGKPGSGDSALPIRSQAPAETGSVTRVRGVRQPYALQKPTVISQEPVDLAPEADSIES